MLFINVVLSGDNAIVVGMALLTFGFFTAHTAASGWIGRIARRNQSHASALYLLAYYAGSSIAGSSGGVVWRWGGWEAVVAFVGLLYAGAMVAALVVARLTAQPKSAP